MPRARPRADGSSAARLLSRKIDQRTAHLSVVGLGYVGLPLAVEFGKAGFLVTGIDTDEKRVRQLERGVSYIRDVPTRQVQALVREGQQRASSHFSVLRESAAVNVCVAAPVPK